MDWQIGQDAPLAPTAVAVVVTALGKGAVASFTKGLARDLGRELQDIVRRGTCVTFVFASGEPGFALLRLEAGSLLNTLGGNYRVRLIERADHTFSQSGPRSTLERILSEELYGSFARRESALE